MSKQSIEKKYFELITSGHYVDVMNAESRWVMARVVQKDKRYIWVVHDGSPNKQQQLFLNSYKVAPLRLHTEGFTGSYSKIYRSNLPRIGDYKNYLQVARQKSLFQQKAKPFQITQLIRGELFVYVHDLICRESTFTPSDILEVNSFLESFVDFVLIVVQKALNYKDQYFSITNNKLSYLTNPKISLIESLQQLLLLMELILKADGNRFANLWKVSISLIKYNKGVTSQEKLSEYFDQRKGLTYLWDIFVSNDKNGKWYPSSVRKSIYKIMVKNTLAKSNFKMPVLPRYEVRDFQQFYSIYPFMTRCTPEVGLQNEFVDFSIRILLTNSSFDAKLKSIQELRKVLQGKGFFQYLDKGKILTKIDQFGVLEQLLQNKNFNPEVFKRFVPIISMLAKTKSLSMKQIHTLFQIVKYRHESQTEMIFEIISDICEFAPSSSLDNVYAEICKIDINSAQTIKFIKTFTMRAVENLSKEKSMFSGLFGRKKGSSKYGYYGLNLLYKQTQDEGRISRQMLLFTLGIIKELLSESLFLEQRWSYISSCVEFIKKRKNFGQSIKLISLILGTFSEATFWGEDRKKAVEKLEYKFGVIENILQGFKSIQNICETKVLHGECYQYFYELINMLSVYLKVPLKTSQIEFLWYKGEQELLFGYLKRSKPDDKYRKTLTPQIIEQILTIIIKKPSFYNRKLTLAEFETIYELFLSYHLGKDNIVIKANGFLIRYNTINLLGMEYFMTFLERVKDETAFQKAGRMTIELFMRPKRIQNMAMEVYIESKVGVWLQMLKRLVFKLISRPRRCLLIIQLFFSAIDGKLYKQINRSDSSNAQILVQCNNEQKIVSIQRFSTIYRLRRVIKQKFHLMQDFSMYNTKINKTITFEEEEQFSVNAMPFYENGKEVSLRIELKNNKLHQQQMACLLFKQAIQKEQKLYQELFKILQNEQIDLQVEKMFWRTIELLPLNKKMMFEIERCDGFSLQKWTEYLTTHSDSSLQYKLNIVLNLIKQSDKWVAKMEQTHGLLAMVLLMIRTVNKEAEIKENETLVLKIVQVIEKVYQKCPKKQIEMQILLQANQTVIKVLKREFPHLRKEKQQGQCQKPHNKESIFSKERISLELLNRLLSLYLSNLKLLQHCPQQSQNGKIDIETFLSILDYGLFIQKSESSQRFSQEVIISLNYALYDNLQSKKTILGYMVSQLNIGLLLAKERTENYFRFFITLLYSVQNQLVYGQPLIDQQKQSMNYPTTTKMVDLNDVLMSIQNFFYLLVDCKQVPNDNQKTHEQIIFGALSLLKFLLFKTNTQNPQQTFQTLIDAFLLPINNSGKKLKSEKNKKILYEIIKKISFETPSVLNSLFDKLAPYLQKNKLRKNLLMNWSLHFENSEKKFFVGLENLGATCYINCLFQQLFMIDAFRQSFLSIDSREFRPQLEKNEIYQLQRIFYSLKYGNRRSETTKSFCSSFITFEGEPINPVVQSDADEFFNTLMDRVQTFLKSTNHSNILQDTFLGKLSNQLNCEGCPHRSEKIEPFMSIGVNLKNKKTLEEALKGYVQGEILDGDNAYYCELCDKKVRTLKRLCIKELPNILVIVLKRFEYDFDTYKKLKINSYLQFPEKLNMTEYTSQYIESKSMEKLQTTNSSDSNIIEPNLAKNNFHLRGAVIHAGYAQAGHYYSFIKDNQEWFEFNDQFIRKIKYDKVQEEGFGGESKDSDEMKVEKYKNAYILFYEREGSGSEKKIDTNLNSLNDNKALMVQGSHDNLFLAKVQENPSKQKMHQQQTFSQQMIAGIQNESLDANVFATLLEPNFIHFIENLSILEHQFVRKFIFLYFHTVILRDKMKYEFAANYFRVLTKYLTNGDTLTTTEGNEHKKDEQKLQNTVENKSQNIQTQNLSDWFLLQVNKSYVRQFLIEAPKSVRYVCVSLILTAIHYASSVPQSIPMIMVSSMRKTGMQPFGLVFKALLNRTQTRQKLVELKYFQIVCNMLLNNEKKNQPLQLPIIVNEEQSYFGADSSQHEAQKEKCSGALLESLQLYDGLSIEMIFQANQSYSFRRSNKVLLKRMCQLMVVSIKKGEKDINDIASVIRTFEEKITSSNCGKEFVEKYLFLMRFLVGCFGQTNVVAKVNELVCDSFQSFIMTTSKAYEPMDWIARQLTKIAHRNRQFKDVWRKKILMNVNLSNEMENWLRQTERLEYVNLKDDFFSNIRQLDNKQKSRLLKKYNKKMRQKTMWMFSSEGDLGEEQVEESDIQQVNEGGLVSVRNRTFLVREKFEKGALCLASSTQKEDQTVWIYLEKGEIETFLSI